MVTSRDPGSGSVTLARAEGEGAATKKWGRVLMICAAPNGWFLYMWMGYDELL